jgi:hypothetical protein
MQAKRSAAKATGLVLAFALGLHLTAQRLNADSGATPEPVNDAPVAAKDDGAGLSGTFWLVGGLIGAVSIARKTFWSGDDKAGESPKTDDDRKLP